MSSLNLTRVPPARTARLIVDGYRHAVRVFFAAQEILVDFSAYPTKNIAKNSQKSTTARSASATPTWARS